MILPLKLSCQPKIDKVCLERSTQLSISRGLKSLLVSSERNETGAGVENLNRIFISLSGKFFRR